ncbi:serine/arginine-rich splicing factor 4-like isoform X2 [Chironomus tepperi]
MITSPIQHLDENDDEDLDMLRKIAMESLKRGRENEFPQDHQFQNVQPIFPNNQPEIIPYENNEIPFQSGPFPPHPRPHRMPGNPHYMRPRFNNFGPRHTVRPFIPRGMPHQFPPQPIIPEFVPMPHVNPQFLSQPPQPQIFPPVNEFPLEYVPTPAVRLSPRSAEFIAANEQAMKKASSKRYSRSPPPRRRRSRSGSPIRRRSRSRSPYKRRSPNEINRKRYRSKSPENRVFKSRNNSPKVDKRSKSPQNRSQSPRNARFARRGRDNNRFNNGNNGNGRYNRKRSDSDKEDEKPEQNRSQSKPKEESVKVKEVEPKQKVDREEKKEVKVNKTKSLTPAPEEKSTTPPLLPTKKEKTEQELEDELLASTDEEDGDQLDINMDDNELDFLEDDSESENEGRFKSKPSANVKSSSTLPSKHSVGNSRAYDKGRYTSSRHDYKRDDKYSHSKRRDHGNRRNSPDMDSRRKSPTDRKPIVLNKDKDDAKNSTESERKPMFKSTFKSIDSGEKKAESTATKKSDSRPALVRSYVNKPDVVVEKKSSSVKSVITLNEDSSSKSGKKKIMDRLGEFVGAKGKNEGNRSRASKQV